MPTYLAAGKTNLQFGIWVFRFIIGDSQTPNEKWRRRDYKLDYAAEKASYYPWEEDEFLSIHC
jgi:hypothetical protein